MDFNRQADISQISIFIFSFLTLLKKINLEAKFMRKSKWTIVTLLKTS